MSPCTHARLHKSDNQPAPFSQPGRGRGRGLRCAPLGFIFDELVANIRKIWDIWKPKVKFRVVQFKFQDYGPEELLPKLPESSCIFWDAQNPFPRHSLLSTFVEQEITMKIQHWAGPGSLRRCPFFRSRRELQNGGIETSMRPNPT